MLRAGFWECAPKWARRSVTPEKTTLPMRMRAGKRRWRPEHWSAWMVPTMVPTSSTSPSDRHTSTWPVMIRPLTKNVQPLRRAAAAGRGERSR